MAGSTVCTVHGAGGGAPEGNGNAVKHGGYRSVLRDQLSPEDAAIFDGAPGDARDALADTLRALTVREARVLRFLRDQAADFGGGAEKALTDIQNAKLRAIGEQIRADAAREDDGGLLDAFLDALRGNDDYEHPDLDA